MILIDMDTPKSCTYCPCATEDFGETRCVLGSPDIDWNKRPCTCPMINADGLISREEVLRYISRISVPGNCITGAGWFCEKELCEDAIDRQALRAQFNHLDEVYEEMSEEEEHEAYIYGQIIRAIDDAPPVVPKQEWIHVSEDLPKESGEYLVSVIDEYDENYEAVGVARYNVEEGEWQDLGVDQTVIAWMPKPASYKEGVSE